MRTWRITPVNTVTRMINLIKRISNTSALEAFYLTAPLLSSIDTTEILYNKKFFNANYCRFLLASTKYHARHLYNFQSRSN